MNWKIRKIIQDTILSMPNGITLYGRLMNYLNKSHQPEYWLEDKFSHSEFHLTAFQKSDQGPPNTILEIGTGWFPLVPLFLSLRGVKQVITADVNPHLNKTSLFRSIQTLTSAILEDRWANCNWHEERKRALISFANLPIPSFEKQIQFLSSIGIDFQTFSPADGLSKILSKYRIEQIISNNTLNCIEEQYIFLYLENMFKYLPHKSIQSHHLDLTDPRSHSDSKISAIDFLQYKEEQWNAIGSQGFKGNRLRASQWIALFEKAGFQLLDMESIPHTDSPYPMALNERFAHLPETDFQIGWLKIIVQKP